MFVSNQGYTILDCSEVSSSMYLLQLSLLYLCTTSLNPSYPSYPYQQSNSAKTTSVAQTATQCTCNGDIFTSDSDITPSDDIIPSDDVTKKSDAVLGKSADLQLQNNKKTSPAWHRECNFTARKKQKEEKSSHIWTIISVLLYVYLLCVPLRLSESARDVTDIEVRTLSL